MVLYQFKCKNCDNETEEIFPASEYNKRVMEDGRLKRKKCEECKTLSVYRHITKAPTILGGPGGYVSMERYWQQNPDIAKKKEEALHKRLQERHRKKVMEQIDKQQRRSGSQERGKGYKEDHDSID